MLMSSGFRTSAMLAMDETEMLDSVSIAIDGDMRVAIDNAGHDKLAVGFNDLGASPGALRSAPTAAIFPFLMRMEPCSIVPCVTVRMVALWQKITEGASAVQKAKDCAAGRAWRAKLFRKTTTRRRMLEVSARFIEFHSELLPASRANVPRNFS